MRINADLLASLASGMFELAMNANLSPDLRQSTLALGKRLRAAWLNLVTAEFDENTLLFKEASETLETTNERLKEARENVDKVAGSLEVAARLLGVLDRLLVTAVKFL